MTTLIVCGGRVGRNLTKRRIFAVLDHLTQGVEGAITIVHGRAAWVDKWSGQWARERGHIEKPYEVDGAKDGYKPDAPFNRNRRMRDANRHAEMCIGFPGGGGTNDMMSICHDVGMPVADVEIEADGTWEIKWWPQK